MKFRMNTFTRTASVETLRERAEQRPLADAPRVVASRSGRMLEAEGGQDRAPAKQSHAAAEPERSGRIVIAEDDEVTRVLIARILTQAGFTVHAFENGKLACDAVRRDGADLVLLDWMMPVMDGPTAVAQLKASLDTRGIPVVMLTSQSDIDERVVALRTGVQDFLTKPFDTRELVARIEQQLSWRKMLAVDANTAFAGERLKLYRPVMPDSAEQSDGTPVPSFFDRIWGKPSTGS